MCPRASHLLVLLSAAVLSGSCGAGLVTGIVTTSQREDPVRPAPELGLPPEQRVLPLVPAPDTRVTVLVANATLSTAAGLRVLVEAAGAVAEQLAPTVVPQGGSTSVAFTVATGPILARVQDPKLADVPAVLRIVVGRADVAPGIPIVLARQPVATLDLPATESHGFVSPFGGRVTLRVSAMRAGSDDDVQVTVTTRDPNRVLDENEQVATIVRPCTEVTMLPPDASGVRLVSAVLPGSTFPTQAVLTVLDPVAGKSTDVENAWYRPEVVQALPRQGSTTGGRLVTLNGTALVPLDFAAGIEPVPPAFDAVRVLLAKGGRVTELARTDFRFAESGVDRLVFTIPASPDGRPGQVDIVVRVALGGVEAQVTASQVFLFANPEPFFGPRGTVLDRLPVAETLIALDGAPGGDDAPDFAVLYEEGGVGSVQLLLAQENGMFQRFGAPRRVGNHEVAAERGPRDICAADFDGDSIPDLFVANAGASHAVHHLVLGNRKPNAPLGAVHTFVGSPGTAICRVGDFDQDGRPDVLLVPGVDAPTGILPQVMLARPGGQGSPGFALPILVPARKLPYEAVAVADLDQDGRLDVAFASGTKLQLDVCHGNGDGTFGLPVSLDFTVPGYQADRASLAVGLHPSGVGSLPSLTLVLAGLLTDAPGIGATPPTIVVLEQASLRQWSAPVADNVLTLESVPIGASLLQDVTLDPGPELVVGARGVPDIAGLGILGLTGRGYSIVAGAIETGAELPRDIRGLHYGRAFPATGTSPEKPALFVVHESLIDGVLERRLSTRLLYTSPQPTTTLLPPDAGAQIALPIEGIVGGDFSRISIAGNGSVRDLALGHSQGISLLENDGFGGFPIPVPGLSVPGLLPRSLARVPRVQGPVDALAFAVADGRLGVWEPPVAGVPGDPGSPGWVAMTSDLRPLLASARLHAAPVANTTRLRVGDVDGDGVPDVVALLSFGLPARVEGEAGLVLLRGRHATATDPLPFEEPQFVTPVHGNASALVLGDFAAGLPGTPVRLEVAVAIPVGSTVGGPDGDHVRFYHYEPAGGGLPARLVPSFVSGGTRTLLAGSGPVQLAAADLDRDGTVDLLVTAAVDSTLRFFRNTAPLRSNPGPVDVDRFEEGQASRRQMNQGLPRALRLGDINGDGSLDALVVLESIQTNVRSTSVEFFLNSGAGEFSRPEPLSRDRLGDRDAEMVTDLGDWNRDGVLDLFLGWNTVGDRNVRVLFGGTR